MPADSIRPRLCLVTDRRRLAESLGIAPADAGDALVDQVLGAITGGVDLVQIREPDLEGRQLADLTRRIVTTAGSRARIVVNDRLDTALAAAAHGVHLREAGVPPDRVRRMVPEGFILGRSIHGEEGVGHAGSVDYLVAGHVFDTASKPGAAGALGVRGLRRIVEMAGPVPVLAIGGMTRDRVAEVAETGAAGLAAIGAFIPMGPVRELSSVVQKLAAELRFRFDSYGYVP